MLKERETAVRHMIMAIDGLVVIFSFMLTFFLRQHFHLFYHLDLIPSARVVANVHFSFTAYLPVLSLLAPIWLFALSVSGMYESLRTKTVLEVVWIVIKAVPVATVVFGTAVFLFKLDFVSRAFFLMFTAMTALLLAVEKFAVIYALHVIRGRGYNYRNLLIVGTGRRAAQFIQKVTAHPEWGFKIAGLIDYEHIHVGRQIEGQTVIGVFEDIPRILHATAIDQVIFIVPRTQLSAIENYLYVCETLGVRTFVAVDLFDLKISRLQQSELDGVPLIAFATGPTVEWQLLIKRIADICIAGFLIILLLPVFILTAVLIAVTSPGPVFFLQKRVGLNGRTFVLYKFRSMYRNAHRKLSELSGRNEMTGPVFKMKSDPRVTPLGRFLRKFSIDELPQLFNVFNGDMSLVGPRPPLAKEVSQYESWQRRRLSMRPGITCLWQISGRNKIGFEEWMRLDLEYIDNWSLWLDFKILVKTVPVVLFGIGAY